MYVKMLNVILISEESSDDIFALDVLVEFVVEFGLTELLFFIKVVLLKLLL